MMKIRPNRKKSWKVLLELRKFQIQLSIYKVFWTKPKWNTFMTFTAFQNGMTLKISWKNTAEKPVNYWRVENQITIIFLDKSLLIGKEVIFHISISHLKMRRRNNGKIKLLMNKTQKCRILLWKLMKKLLWPMRKMKWSTRLPKSEIVSILKMNKYNHEESNGGEKNQKPYPQLLRMRWNVHGSAAPRCATSFPDEDLWHINLPTIALDPFELQ